MEFGEGAFKTVDEFVRKTRNLDYEFLIYFDYHTGEILKCAKGGEDNVRLDFEEDEFEGHDVASIHNHPREVYSPPSGKNFGILARNFEDYELVSSVDGLWILKAKGFHPNLFIEFKFMADLFLRASFDDAKLKFDDWNKINDKCDKKYGKQLSNYINYKNINDIQLSKKEYVMMDNNTNIHIADYNCVKKIWDPEEFRKADERNADPNILTGKDAVYALYQLMGMEIEYDEIFAD